MQTNQSPVLCKDCKHLYLKSGRHYWCQAPQLGINLVDGSPNEERCADMRSTGTDPRHPDAAAIPNRCGSSGQFFLPVAGQCTECGGTGNIPPNAVGALPCENCHGTGYYRPPYSSERVPCERCTSRPISSASATTDASPNPSGSNA